MTLVTEKEQRIFDLLDEESKKQFITAREFAKRQIVCPATQDFPRRNSFVTPDGNQTIRTE